MSILEASLRRLDIKCACRCFRDNHQSCAPMCTPARTHVHVFMYACTRKHNQLEVHACVLGYVPRACLCVGMPSVMSHETASRHFFTEMNHCSSIVIDIEQRYRSMIITSGRTLPVVPGNRNSFTLYQRRARPAAIGSTCALRSYACVHVRVCTFARVCACACVCLCVLVCVFGRGEGGGGGGGS